VRLAWQQIPSTIISDILCLNNLNGVVLDTEHACFSNETLYSCIQIITSNNKECFVRLGNSDDSMIRFCLDAGATGLIFSTIETPEQVQEINQLCKYPKYNGKRGLGLVRQNKWGLEELINKPPILIAQIETETGARNIEKLLGFDFYMIGPYDLSASLGIPGKFDDPRFLSAVEKINKFIPNSKMAVHIPKDVRKEIKKYNDYGIIAVGMDTTVLIESHKEMENA